MERLKSVKRYFLTDRGDWLVQFLDTAHEELSKETRFINKARLESLLSLAVVTSVSSSDEYRDDLTCELMPCSALDEVIKVISITGKSDSKDAAEDAGASLTGFEAFSLKYKGRGLRKEMNIILHNGARITYRWLFRHRFQYKLAERELSSAWASHQGSKAFIHQSCARLAFALDIALRARMMHFIQSVQHYLVMDDIALRARMMHFIQSVQHYLVMDVIENCWHTFLENMRAVKTVEEWRRNREVQHYIVMDVIEKCWHTFIENMRAVKTVEEVLTIHNKFLDSLFMVLTIHNKFLDSCVTLFMVKDPHP
ncbi:Spc98 family-domain-containing protein [Baffinella frigidus]|nr:Spc98 family-domain-containing protein [Cryptophyta sp. CCMP2293]